MKKLLLFFGFLGFCGVAWASWTVLATNQISFPGVDLLNGVPGDGSLVLNGRIERGRTALDLWPVNGELPSEHALTEHVLYRTRYQDWPNFERMNWSAMAAGISRPAYRFGVERGGAGQFRDIIFAYESVASDPAAPNGLEVMPIFISRGLADPARARDRRPVISMELDKVQVVGLLQLKSFRDVFCDESTLNSMTIKSVGDTDHFLICMRIAGIPQWVEK